MSCRSLFLETMVHQIPIATLFLYFADAPVGRRTAYDETPNSCFILVKDRGYMIIDIYI